MVYKKPAEGEVSHVTPPCSGCGEPARIRGGTAVLVHKDGCRIKADDEWYDSYGLAVHILGKSWPDVLTLAEEDFCEAFADEISERPEAERGNSGYPDGGIQT